MPWFFAFFFATMFIGSVAQHMGLDKELRELKEMVYENKIVRNCVMQQINEDKK